MLQLNVALVFYLYFFPLLTECIRHVQNILNKLNCCTYYYFSIRKRKFERSYIFALNFLYCQNNVQCPKYDNSNLTCIACNLLQQICIVEVLQPIECLIRNGHFEYQCHLSLPSHLLKTFRCTKAYLVEVCKNIQSFYQTKDKT